MPPSTRAGRAVASRSPYRDFPQSISGHIAQLLSSLARLPGAPAACLRASQKKRSSRNCFSPDGLRATMRAPMQRHRPTSGDTVSPAPTYALHRRRALMSVFPTAIAVTVAATLLYVILDYLASAPEGHWFIYLLELAVP